MRDRCSISTGLSASHLAMSDLPIPRLVWANQTWPTHPPSQCHQLTALPQDLHFNSGHRKGRPSLTLGFLPCSTCRFKRQFTISLKSAEDLDATPMCYQLMVCVRGAELGKGLNGTPAPEYSANGRKKSRGLRADAASETSGTDNSRYLSQQSGPSGVGQHVGGCGSFRAACNGSDRPGKSAPSSRTQAVARHVPQEFLPSLLALEEAVGHLAMSCFFPSAMAPMMARMHWRSRSPRRMLKRRPSAQEYTSAFPVEPRELPARWSCPPPVLQARDRQGGDRRVHADERRQGPGELPRQALLEIRPRDHIFHRSCLAQVRPQDRTAELPPLVPGRLVVHSPRSARFQFTRSGAKPLRTTHRRPIAPVRPRPPRGPTLSGAKHPSERLAPFPIDPATSGRPLAVVVRRRVLLASSSVEVLQTHPERTPPCQDVIHNFRLCLDRRRKGSARIGIAHPPAHPRRGCAEGVQQSP